MLIVKDTNPFELEELKDKYKIILDLDYENPTFYFTFKEDNIIIGYSEIKIFNNVPELVNFCLQGNRYENEKMFFLKATGSKVMDLGYDILKLRNDVINFYEADLNTILLDNLFKGNCNGC